MNNSSILPGHPSSPVILHVPHASRTIPPEIRAALLLDDAALDAELDEATDTGTDLIAALGADHAQVRPWIVCNAYSRLVVDPERFPDDSEPATAYGRGAVYTRTCTGTPLRQEPLTDLDALLDAYFRPYATAVADLVTASAPWTPKVLGKNRLHTVPVEIGAESAMQIRHQRREVRCGTGWPARGGSVTG
ncbi:N-formylglutamate amidohydrolase [Rhodococcus aetherivorans]|uniref:N-formylglutamate amidohydrolase n=1 Tax=Rhodococcus aetherivorans TaxID=191292 RepID=UPI0021AD5EDD|nr:N-formylglutamate amidohydrolase [Rhodococcus aetherivorans]